MDGFYDEMPDWGAIVSADASTWNGDGIGSLSQLGEVREEVDEASASRIRVCQQTLTFLSIKTMSLPSPANSQDLDPQANKRASFSV